MTIVNKSSRQRGSSIVEMALVFVPLMFSVFSVFELGRAMWMYHTLASAVKKGARVAMVHGDRCAEASPTCPISISDLVQTIQSAGVGLDMSALELTFGAGSNKVTCSPANSCLGEFFSLASSAF